MLLPKLPRPFGYVNFLLLPYPRTGRDQIARTILAHCVCLSSSVLAGRVELPSPLYQNGVITVILCKVGCLNGDRTHDLFRVEEAHYRCAMRHWSERGESNSRRLGPKPSDLPLAYVPIVPHQGRETIIACFKLHVNSSP